MAHDQEGPRLPLKAASAIAQYVPVTMPAGGSALSETVIRAGSINDFPLGFTTATIATYGEAVGVQYAGVVKGVAGASLGAGAPLGVGSTNGILIPLAASNIASSANGTGVRWMVGVALKNAAAADLVPVWIKPDQII